MGLGWVQLNPCHRMHLNEGHGLAGAAPSTSCDDHSMGGAHHARDECSAEVSSHAGSGNRHSGSGKRR